MVLKYLIRENAYIVLLAWEEEEDSCNFKWVIILRYWRIIDYKYFI